MGGLSEPANDEEEEEKKHDDNGGVDDNDGVGDISRSEGETGREDASKKSEAKEAERSWFGQEVAAKVLGTDGARGLDEEEYETEIEEEADDEEVAEHENNGNRDDTEDAKGDDEQATLLGSGENPEEEGASGSSAP